VADIFLSCKKEDRRHAERVANALHARGWSVWWDDGLTPHEANDHGRRALPALWVCRPLRRCVGNTLEQHHLCLNRGNAFGH
jgi:hypothetical protein